jgi:hypothetical protein
VYSIQHYVIKVCQGLATDRWFSPGTPVSPTSKTDRHDKTEILLKVALDTIALTKIKKRCHFLLCVLPRHSPNTWQPFTPLRRKS